MLFYSSFVFFLIASAQSINKLILTMIPPTYFVGIRMGLSGFFLIIMFCLKIDVLRKAKENIGALFVVALFTTFIPSLMRAYALSHLPSSRAAFWGTFEPFVTAVYMYILHKERLTLKQIAGCIVGVFAGAFFVFIQNASLLFDLKTFLYITFPDLIQIGSVCISRYGWLKAQNILQKNIFQPKELNGFTHFISGMLALVLSFGSGEMKLLSFSSSSKFIFLMFYTVVIGNMLAYTLYATLLKKQSATFISLAGLSVPLFVHLLGPIFLKESISGAFFIASGMIFIALYLFHSGKKK